MKKLLLLTAISLVSVISCNKEKSLTTENSQFAEQSLKSSYKSSYMLSNHRNFSNGDNLVAPGTNEDMARVWYIDPLPEFPTSELYWYVEVFKDGYVRFWSLNRSFLEHWRVLDIDWRHPNEDNSINAVMWLPNIGPNQLWELIGSIDKESSGQLNSFYGVIVNKYSGQMLELANSRTTPEYAIAKKLYKGSDEEKYYNKHGNFDNYPIDTTTTIWHIR
ncbi:MAG: RICIN domain-containing protein [Solitalea-like symbiont of Tyrophagus putrescentiae]